MELQQTQTLKQNLSPQMLQSMKILQMGMQDLRDYVMETIQENPVLDFQENSSDSMSVQNNQAIDWTYDSDYQNSYFYKQDNNNDCPDLLCNVSDDSCTHTSLADYIWSQFVCSDLPSDVLDAIKFLITQLDKDGFLTESLANISKMISIDSKVLKRALSELHKAEPLGVGARNLKECLLIQLNNCYPNATLEATLIENYLNELSSKKFKYISAELNLSEREIKSAYTIISNLNPHPGSGFSDDENLQFITPDVYVEATESSIEIVCNKSYVPTLIISPYYSKLLSDTTDSKVKKYLTEKTNQAKWVVNAIEQRQNTLALCIKEIVSRQSTFFTSESTYLSPMALSDIAKALDIHESTVSRAIRDKFLQCQKGVFPISYFFSRGYTSNDGQAISACSIKEKLKAYFDEESKKKPLSDQKLSELLLKDGYKVSRRTITKYREELGIPTASERRAV